MTKFKDIVEEIFERQVNIKPVLRNEETVKALLKAWDAKVAANDLEFLKEATLEEAELSANIQRHYKVKATLSLIRSFLSPFIDGEKPLPCDPKTNTLQLMTSNHVYPNIIIKQKSDEENAHGIYDVNTNTIYLCLLDNQNRLTSDGKVYVFTNLNSRLRRTLAHELRHFYDIYEKHEKFQLPDTNVTDEEKARAYYNNPIEMNAFTDELSEAIYEFLLENWYTIEDEFFINFDVKPVDEKYLKLIEKAIAIAIDTISKENSNLAEFLYFLTPANKKQVLKTIATWYGRDLCYYFNYATDRIKNLKSFVKLHKLKK